ncbi:MAG: serine/threonine-protein kinase, partial [Ardenticatenaceae bacterium]
MIDLSSIPDAIHQRYKIAREIGRGGFATVYLARDEQLGRDVAIKLYHVQEGDADIRPDVGTILSQEGKLLASLSHANIVAVHDAGIADSRPYIVMAYLAGGSLRDKLAGGKSPMRPQDALGLVAVLAEALHAAHEEDILHLDIKPENIIFDQRGRPFLTDFGIGRTMGGDEETEQTRAMGSNNYAPPEQRQGQKLSRASDIYSLGVVLFELLTHQVPLGPAPSSPQPPYSPPFPMNHPVTSAEGLVKLVCKALAVAPEYRFESALEFAHRVRDYLLQAGGDTGQLAPRWSRGMPLSGAKGRPGSSPRPIQAIEIREPQRPLRRFEVRRVPQTVRQMEEDLTPVPPGTRIDTLLYSHQGLEVGVGSVVEQAVFARGRIRLRQEALVRGDVISLTMIDVSQGVQAANLLAPEVMLRGPVRLTGSIFCRRLRPGHPRGPDDQQV